MSNQVHAPYHFVPLSKWVYLPEWAHLVSHDHPFEDGLSGSINIKLINKTELLVGANTTRQERQPSQVHWAKTPNGKPVIPGSSLKGMVRSFLETATFAKFKQVDDNRYAYRDISGAKTSYSQILQNTNDQAAWLIFDSVKGNWQYRRCKHTRLYGKDINQYLSTQKIQEKIDNNLSTQTTLKKYQIWPLNKAAINFSVGEYFTAKNNKPRECAITLGNGSYQGIPVFTGYRPGRGKDLDFNYMFFDVSDTSEFIEASLVNQMFAAHDEELIQYLKEKGHSKFGIPIFIRESKKRGEGIVALGLAKMPKMLYDESVASLANAQQTGWIENDVSFDLCELMFGTLRDYGIGLKSRVIFSDAQCIKDTGTKNSTPVILGQPQASYLNAYLEQQHHNGNVRGELTKYDEGAKLAGWKRYPAQAKFSAHLPDDLKGKVNVQSKLELLKPGAEFSGRVVFHNLKPMELGALLWALNPNEKFHHGLGHGKSLGAGAVQLTAELKIMHDQEALSAEALIRQFIEHMNAQYPALNMNDASWENSAQVQHLLAFGDLEDNRNKNLDYMPLQKGAATVTYANSKASGSRKALPNWQANNEELKREDNAKAALYVPQGRLAGLVKALVQDEAQRESMAEAVKALAQEKEARALEAAKEQKQQELAAQKENASDIFKRVLELQEHFEIYRGNTSTDANNQRIPKHAEITEILQQVVAGESGASASECQAMYDFAMDFEFTAYFDVNVKAKDLSKKQKPRHQEKQALLQQLAELIK